VATYIVPPGSLPFQRDKVVKGHCDFCWNVTVHFLSADKGPSRNENSHVGQAQDELSLIRARPLPIRLLDRSQMQQVVNR
jgi:hypothetical protein